MTRWIVTHEDPYRTEISRHSTLALAERAFLRRNPHWRGAYAQRQGMTTAGTFDRIRREDEGILDTAANYNPERRA